MAQLVDKFLYHHKSLVGFFVLCLVLNSCTTEIVFEDFVPVERIEVGRSVRLDGSGSFDPHERELEFLWRQVEGPVVTLKNADTPWPEFTPTGPGRYAFELTTFARGSDGRRTQSSVSAPLLRINILPPNRIPIAILADTYETTSGVWVLLDAGKSNDPDGDELEFIWSVVGGNADGSLEFSSLEMRGRRLGVRSWQTGEYRVQLVVKDAYGQSKKVQTILKVTEPHAEPISMVRAGEMASGINEAQKKKASANLRLVAYPHPDGGENIPPVAVGGIAGPDGRGRYILFADKSYDKNNDALTFRWIQTEGPKVAVLESLTGRNMMSMRFLPSADAFYKFKLIAKDAQESSSPVFVELNLGGKVKRSVSPFFVNWMGDAHGVEFEVITAEINTEVELKTKHKILGDASEYNWRQTSGPIVSAFRMETGVDVSPLFVPKRVGIYEFVLLHNFEAPPKEVARIRVVVPEPNHNPVIDVVPNVQMFEGDELQLTARAYDSDGDPVKLIWRAEDDEFLLTRAENGVDVRALKWGEYDILLIARDDKNGEATARVRVTVHERAMPPVAIIDAPIEVELGERVELRAVDSYDPAGAKLRYKFSCEAATLVRIKNANRARASFLPPEEGDYTIRLRVDAGSRSAEVLRKIYVRPKNIASSVQAKAVPAVLGVGEMLTLDISCPNEAGGMPWREWVQLEGSRIKFPKNAARVCITPLATGRYVFEARDVLRGESLDRVEFKVVEHNHPPIVKTEVVHAEDGSVTLSAKGSYDREHQPLEYTWTELSNVEGIIPVFSSMRSSRHTKKVSAPPSGSYSVRVSVSDGVRVAHSAIITFEVK